MQPIGAVRDFALEYELVVRHMLACVVIHLLRRLASAGVYVCRLAHGVLACRRATHEGVEALTAISACDAYRAKPSAERFERLLAEGA